MLKAQEMEAKLAEEERVCNDTMMALWEECKPCLKNTCVKYYSKTCSSGSGMVGHQVRSSCSGCPRRNSFLKKALLTFSPAAGGPAKSHSSLLHLDQRGEDRHAGASRAAAEGGILPTRRKIRRNGRRCGQHLFRQHEGIKGLTSEQRP